MDPPVDRWRLGARYPVCDGAVPAQRTGGHVSEYRTTAGLQAIVAREEHAEAAHERRQEVEGNGGFAIVTLPHEAAQGPAERNGRDSTGRQVCRRWTPMRAQLPTFRTRQLCRERRSRAARQPRRSHRRLLPS